MKLEVGGIYLNRIGHEIKIVSDEHKQPWVFRDENHARYREDGHWFMDKEHAWDLVERIDVPSMQEDAAPLPPSETPVAVGWSGRFSKEDVDAVWQAYIALLMGVGKYVSMEDLIAERNVLLKELE